MKKTQRIKKWSKARVYDAKQLAIFTTKVACFALLFTVLVKVLWQLI